MERAEAREPKGAPKDMLGPGPGAPKAKSQSMGGKGGGHMGHTSLRHGAEHLRSMHPKDKNC